MSSQSSHSNVNIVKMAGRTVLSVSAGLVSAFAVDAGIIYRLGQERCSMSTPSWLEQVLECFDQRQQEMCQTCSGQFQLGLQEVADDQMKLVVITLAFLLVANPRLFSSIARMSSGIIVSLEAALTFCQKIGTWMIDKLFTSYERKVAFKEPLYIKKTIRIPGYEIEISLVYD